MAYEDTPIGSLRWPVIIATRVQTAAGQTTIAENLYDVMHVRADIEPIGAQTFYLGAQIDRPFTHRIRIRWLDWVDETHVIVRQTKRLDQTIRTEVFRVRRVKELDGRKRFLELECEQETRV